MTDDIREYAERYLSWLSKMGLYQTEYFASFYYIEIDAIGPAAYSDELDELDELDGYEEWLQGSDYDDWEAGRRRQLREVRKLNRRHSHRFREYKR